MKLPALRALLGEKKTFTLTYKKRSGKLSTINARLGVKAYLKGGVKPYNDDEKGLLTVFNMQKKAYRSIPIDTISQIMANGQKITIEKV